MNVFISYHRSDTKQKNKLETILKENKISYYSIPKDADFSGWSHEKIKTEIIEILKSCDVVICLVGKETYSRPHVDHELHEALKGKPGERKGIVVLMIENRGDSKNKVNLSTFPSRLADNLNEYVVLEQFSATSDKIYEDIQLALVNSRNLRIQVKNTAPTMQLRQTKYYET